MSILDKSKCKHTKSTVYSRFKSLPDHVVEFYRATYCLSCGKETVSKKPTLILNGAGSIPSRFSYDDQCDHCNSESKSISYTGSRLEGGSDEATTKS